MKTTEQQIAKFELTHNGYSYSVLVARSRTGMYHHGIGPMAVYCNSRRLANRPAMVQEVARASTTMFCVKCFNPQQIEQLQTLARGN